jgi:hypothetical protein
MAEVFTLTFICWFWIAELNSLPFFSLMMHSSLFVCFFFPPINNLSPGGEGRGVGLLGELVMIIQPFHSCPIPFVSLLWQLGQQIDEASIQILHPSFSSVALINNIHFHGGRVSHLDLTPPFQSHPVIIPDTHTHANTYVLKHFKRVEYECRKPWVPSWF